MDPEAGEMTQARATAEARIADLIHPLHPVFS
jgi:hypothetical protein